MRVSDSDRAVSLFSIRIEVYLCEYDSRLVEDYMKRESYYQDIARAEWERARRRGSLDSLLDRLRDRRLVSFETVRALLRLRQCHYLGIQQVSLDRIVGSVGRYNDFTTHFLPRSNHLRQRWQAVSATTGSVGAPPVKLFKVADAYFVLDGNHRISVAHASRAGTIEAEVCEYATDIEERQAQSFAERLLRCWWLEGCHESILADFGLQNSACSDQETNTQERI